MAGFLLLAGCSSYNESFDCEPGLGVGCKSLGQVNDMVDRGELPLKGVDSPEEEKPPLVSEKPVPQKPSNGFHIWFAPLQESL